MSVIDTVKSRYDLTDDEAVTLCAAVRDELDSMGFGSVPAEQFAVFAGFYAAGQKRGHDA